MLHPLGLDEKAQSVYRFALGRQGCTVDDVVGALGMPADDVSATIDALSELRLLRRVSGTLLPGSPSVALQSLLERQEAELLRRQQEFAETRAAASRLIAEYDHACGSGVRHEWEHLDGPVAVETRMGILARQARSECFSMLPADPRTTVNLLGRKALDRELLNNGVAVSTIMQECLYNDRVSMRYAEWLTREGARVATSPTLPLWMVIFDRATALLPADPASGCCSAVEVTGTGIVNALTALFEAAWSSATPMGATRYLHEAEPTSAERELLRLLCQGLTDEAVSKKLGLGLRTVRRMVADLMTRLDARSRFEAGANAVHRGWLEPGRDCPSQRGSDARGRANPLASVT